MCRKLFAIAVALMFPLWVGAVTIETLNPSDSMVAVRGKVNRNFTRVNSALVGGAGDVSWSNSVAFHISSDNTNAWTRAGVTNALQQADINAWLSWRDTNVYVKTESDPLWNTWLGTNAYIKAETDPGWNAWLGTNAYLKTESDPVWNTWLGTNAYVKVESDPLWNVWLSTNTYVKTPSALQAVTDAGSDTTNILTLIGSNGVEIVTSSLFEGASFTNGGDTVAETGIAVLPGDIFHFTWTRYGSEGSKLKPFLGEVTAIPAYDVTNGIFVSTITAGTGTTFGITAIDGAAIAAVSNVHAFNLTVRELWSPRKIAEHAVLVDWLNTNTCVKTEVDPLWNAWLSTNAYVKTESDPLWNAWLGTNAYVKAEADPLWDAWLGTNNYFKCDGSRVLTADGSGGGHSWTNLAGVVVTSAYEVVRDASTNLLQYGGFDATNYWVGWAAPMTGWERTDYPPPRGGIAFLDDASGNLNQDFGTEIGASYRITCAASNLAASRIVISLGGITCPSQDVTSIVTFTNDVIATDTNGLNIFGSGSLIVDWVAVERIPSSQSVTFSKIFRYDQVVAWLSTNAYVKAEADPVWLAWLTTNTLVKTESDPVWSTWLGTNAYVKTEADPLWDAWLGTNTYVKIEADPVASTSVWDLVQIPALPFSQITNPPTLGDLAELDDIPMSTVTNLPVFGDLAELDDVSLDLVTNFPTLGDLAALDDIYYTLVTNAPWLIAEVGTGTVNRVVVNGVTNTPDANGEVDLGEIAGGASSTNARDIATCFSPTNYVAADTNIEAHISGMDAKLGTLGGGSVTLAGSQTYSEWKHLSSGSSSNVGAFVEYGTNEFESGYGFYSTEAAYLNGKPIRLICAAPQVATRMSDTNNILVAVRSTSTDTNNNRIDFLYATDGVNKSSNFVGMCSDTSDLWNTYSVVPNSNWTNAMPVYNMDGLNFRGVMICAESRAMNSNTVSDPVVDIFWK